MVQGADKSQNQHSRSNGTKVAESHKIGSLSNSINVADMSQNRLFRSDDAKVADKSQNRLSHSNGAKVAVKSQNKHSRSGGAKVAESKKIGFLSPSL